MTTFYLAGVVVCILTQAIRYAGHYGFVAATLG